MNAEQYKNYCYHADPSTNNCRFDETDCRVRTTVTTTTVNATQMCKVELCRIGSGPCVNAVGVCRAYDDSSNEQCPVNYEVCHLMTTASTTTALNTTATTTTLTATTTTTTTVIACNPDMCAIGEGPCRSAGPKNIVCQKYRDTEAATCAVGQILCTDDCTPSQCYPGSLGPCIHEGTGLCLPPLRNGECPKGTLECSGRKQPDTNKYASCEGCDATTVPST